jgi:hypothetical protein
VEAHCLLNKGRSGVPGFTNAQADGSQMRVDGDALGEGTPAFEGVGVKLIEQRVHQSRCRSKSDALSQAGSGRLWAWQLNQGEGGPAFLAMLHNNVGMNSTADIPACRDAQEAGLCGFDQVIQDGVGDLFMECPFIAVAPEVHFEAFEFKAVLICDHLKGKVSKIGLPRQGAVTSKLGYLKLNKVVPLGGRVGKYMQFFAWRAGRGVGCSTLRRPA